MLIFLSAFHEGGLITLFDFVLKCCLDIEQKKAPGFDRSFSILF